MQGIIDSLEQWGYVLFKKYSSWLIFFSKYLYGIKTLVPLAIGFSRFNLKKFLMFNLIACVIWAIIVGLCGYYASSGIIMLIAYMKTFYHRKVFL